MGMVKTGRGDGEQVLGTSDKPFLKTKCQKCGVVIVYEEGQPVPELCERCSSSEE